MSRNRISAPSGSSEKPAAASLRLRFDIAPASSTLSVAGLLPHGVAEATHASFRLASTRFSNDWASCRNEDTP